MFRTLSAMTLALGLFGLAQNPAQAAMKEVVGVGVNVDFTADGHLIVQSLIKDAPAEKSGLVKANDEITAVQSTPTSAFVAVAGKTMDDVGALIHGSEGVAVGLKLKRAGAEVTVSIVRGKFMVDDGNQ